MAEKAVEKKTGTIHPEYHSEAQVICACGNTWSVGSTMPVIRTDICSKCHPFFSGEQRIVDSGGQVERFMKKLEARDRAISEEEQRRSRGKSPDLAVTDLDISARAQAVLAGAGMKTVGDILAKLELGDDELTNLAGFGLKSLATLKKKLRAREFVLPGDPKPA
ncbi:MAG: 50S ribosomal protein L31 [Anaerolineales bacterium]|nr:MAG: 50S ribosomal protein L31 [Anaerolineales bacterium]